MSTDHSFGTTGLCNQKLGSRQSKQCSGNSKKDIGFSVLFVPEVSLRIVDSFVRAGNALLDGVSASLSRFLAKCTGFAYLTAHFTFNVRNVPER